MRRSPVSELNKALYRRLSGSLTAPVYDYVPSGKAAPYVVLTDTNAQDWGAKTIAGAEVIATIKIISEYQGDKEVAELADTVITTIQSSALEVEDGWSIVWSSIDKHTVERLDTHREATIQYKFIMIDTKE